MFDHLDFSDEINKYPVDRWLGVEEKNIVAEANMLLESGLPPSDNDRLPYKSKSLVLQAKLTNYKARLGFVWTLKEGEKKRREAQNRESMEYDDYSQSLGLIHMFDRDPKYRDLHNQIEIIETLYTYIDEILWLLRNAYSGSGD
jgi:hypothetical protein